MKKVKALRGVCIGPERHLAAGDSAELDDGTAQFLVSIKAVELVKDEPPPAVEVSETTAPDKKPGKKEK